MSCCSEFVPSGAGGGGGGGGGGNVGPGTLNHLALFTAADAVGDSLAYWDPAGLVFTFPRRVHISCDLNFPPVGGDDPTLTVITSGVAVTQHDGGVQSFATQEYDTNINPNCIAQGMLAANEATFTGGGQLINTAFAASAINGTTNYSFQGTSGILRNNDGFLLGAPGTIGPGAAATGNTVLFHTDLLVDNVQLVSLGQNVANMQMPGLDEDGNPAEPLLGIGFSGGFPYQVIIKNTVQHGAGTLTWADTNISAITFASHTLYRGATSPSPATLRAGFSVGSGADQFAIGDIENALVIWSYDPSGVTRGIQLASGSGPTVRAELTSRGAFSLLGGFKRTSILTPFPGLAAGTTQNYAITGLVTASRVRQITDAANSALGGIVPPSDPEGAEILLLNLGPGTLTLNQADAGSTAANQFALEGGANRVIGVNGVVLLSYDSTLARWTCAG